MVTHVILLACKDRHYFLYCKILGHKKPLLVEWFLKWSRDRDILLLKRCQLSPATSGVCPDSQNGCSDGAKIGKDFDIETK